MIRSLTARQEIWRVLLRGQRSMLLRLSAPLKQQHGLTVPQYEALLTLWECPQRSLPASELAKHLLYSSGSASHLISRLEERGLVERETRDEDARVVRVRLTGEGEALISAATDAHVEQLKAEFEPLINDDEVEVLLRFVRRLADFEGVSTAPPEQDAARRG